MPSDPLAPGTPSWWIRIHLAPLCLLLVAGVQGYRVVTCNQTPWKGGGFGMFSTIDGKDARILKAWLVTDRGRIPVGIPKWLEKRADEVRAAPSEPALSDLAERLAELTWIDRDREWRETFSRYEAPDAPLMTERSLFHGPPSAQAQAAHPLESQTRWTATGRRADVEASGKRQAGGEPGLPVRAVELELSKLWFSMPSCSVGITPLFKARAEVRP